MTDPKKCTHRDKVPTGALCPVCDLGYPEQAPRKLGQILAREGASVPVNRKGKNLVNGNIAKVHPDKVEVEFTEGGNTWYGYLPHTEGWVNTDVFFLVAGYRPKNTGPMAIVENAIKEHTTVDILCVSISQKIIPAAKALNASQAEILTAMLKTSAMYAKHVKKPSLAATLDEIVGAYEKAIAEGKTGLLAVPGTEIAGDPSLQDMCKEGVDR